MITLCCARLRSALCAFRSALCSFLGSETALLELFASRRHFHLWEWATELHVAVGQASACSEGLSRLEDRRAATKLFEVATFDESNLLCLPNMGVF